MKMWSTYRKDIISGKLQEILESEDELSVWQSRDDRKITFKATCIEVSESNTVIRLNSDYENAEYKITKDYPLFIHYAKKDYLFKKDAFKTDLLNITMKTPVELLIKEKRRVDRFSFKYQDYKNVSLEVEKYGKIETISCILKDLSVNGLSFVFHERELKHFSKDNLVKIKSISDQNLPSHLLANICYVTPYSISAESESELYKVGVQFSDSLESVIYKSISSIISKKQLKQKGLEVSTFNGLDHSEIEKILRKISEENLALANNLREQNDVLDRLRYLTIEMKRHFFLEVNLDLLAASLRLSSKELIYDLIIEVTDTMREEFLYKLDQPRSPSAINKAQDEIVTFIRNKERDGELVLDPTSYEVLV